MRAHWTFGRKVGGGFAVAVIALTVIAVTGYRSAQTLIDNDARVAYTQRVRRELASLMAELVDAETGERGFVITGDPEFLQPYNAALAALDMTYGGLHQLISDNAEQLRRIEPLRTMIDRRLEFLKRTIDKRSMSFESAAGVVATKEGKALMDKLREAIDAIDQDQAAVLDVRRRDAEASTEATKLVIAWGSVATVLITIAVGWLLTRSLSGQLGSAARHIQSSSTQLQAAANQQATGAREQATAMAEIATTINELLATSRQIADSAQRVSQIAGQTAMAARSGEDTVTRGREATATLRKQVDQIVGHMLELGKKSQQVGAVLDIVYELAEQTNILAINATIEAAGAGDAGRRFGVVADEIRKLADRVGASTKEIRTMVDDVRSAVNTTVMATESGSKAVDVSAAQVVEMANALRQIASLVGTTTDAAREIELSTKQQATAVEQVNLAITSTVGTTRESEACASQTLQTASQLTGLSTSLLEIVQTRASGHPATTGAAGAS